MNVRCDPRQYEAALFTGDAYYKPNKLDKAGEWFARAIDIDPDRETAYRYWGDVLMAQSKMSEARDKFVEAFITEPFNRLARAGLIRWAQKNRVTLAHPEIKQPPPSMHSSTVGNQTTIMIDPQKMDPNSGPNYYWSFYDLTRATWGKVNFPKEYPNEKVYRHSLKEEAAALRIVAEIASRDLKSGNKSLDLSLHNLIKLNEAGLLEAYILLA